MQIQVTTDHNIGTGEHLIGQVEADVEAALSRFRDRLTRVEVHLGDENAAKFGTNDKRCALEARPRGQKPVGVTHHAATLEAAWNQALHKLANLLEHRFGKLDHHKGGATIRRGDAG